MNIPSTIYTGLQGLANGIIVAPMQQFWNVSPLVKLEIVVITVVSAFVIRKITKIAAEILETSLLIGGTIYVFKSLSEGAASNGIVALATKLYNIAFSDITAIYKRFAG